MVITDLDIIDLILRLYDDKIGADPAAWDALCPVDGSYSALKRVAGTDIEIERGSTTPLDWVEDLEAQMIVDPGLGGVHPGFLAGMRATQAYWDNTLGDKVIICGHSLGAGRAALRAAHLAAIGRPLVKVVLFGCPRPGAAKIAGLLKDVPVVSYRNQSRTGTGYDLITDVPFSIPDVDPYVQPRAFTPVTGLPPANDPWSVFRWHHAELYRTGLATSS